MGSDKASLWLDGEMLVVRVARRVARACARVVVASGDGRRLGSLPWNQIADAVDDVGPLGGVLAGLELAEPDQDLVAVVAVDLPNADPEVLAALGLELRRRRAAVAAPRHAARIQPLHSVWRVDAREALQSYLDGGGRSVHGAFDQLEGVPVDVDHLDPAGRFALNLNRPEDLAALGGAVSREPRPDPPGQGV